MADESIGEVEYGRLPYIGPTPGSVEFGRVPAIGSACKLTVQSSPTDGAAIEVDTPDWFGLDDGTTTFYRYYDKGTVVELTAPAAHGGDPFSKWTVDGVDQVGNPINVTMSADRVAIAVYAAIPPPPPELGIEMLKVMIPKFKYWKSAPAGQTSYPNLEDGQEGKPIPEAYGVLTNITPVCIDAATGKYKLARRAIKSIDAIREGGKALVSGTDYVADLVNAEFTFLTTPLLASSTNYWFVLESDYTINGTDYLKWAWDDEFSEQPANHCYEIDGAGVWSEQAGNNMIFQAFGRKTFGGAETILCTAMDFHSWNGLFKLRDAAARTRRAQKFTTPAGGPWYLSRIVFYYCGMVGSVSSSSHTRVQILSAYNPAEVSVGMKSNVMEGAYWRAKFTQRIGGSNEIRCDIKGLKNADTTLMENIADILYDIYVNVLGGSTSGINAADLATLKAARTQDTALYMSEEKEFQQYLELFEASHLFKFLPSLGGDFAVRCLTSGEPAGTPHLKSEHIKNFSMRRVWNNVFQTAKVKYYQDPSTGDWLVAEEKSDVAQYVYNRQDSIEIETALKDAADAVQLAEDYLGTDGASTRRVHLQYPTRFAEFDVLAGYGDLLIPTMKVKITLPRADYAGGILTGVLFRVLEVTKNPETGESHIVAILDSLTY